MWRAMFLGLGVFSCLVGLECMVIDKAIMARQPQAQTQPFNRMAQSMNAGSNEVIPPPWAPWSFLSGGAVVILYSFTLPQKMKG